MARVDYDELATAYDAARTLPPDAIGAWREALAAWLPPPSGRPLLDLGAFPGRHRHVTLFRYFPGARRVAETFPTVEATAAAFAEAGFAVETLRSVPQVSAPDLRTFLGHVRMRADSTLRPLPYEEFAAGLRALESAAAGPAGQAPVVDRLDLLVLG